MQRGLHGAHGRFDAVHAGLDAAHVRKRRYQANGAVATHAQIPAVVEEHHTRSVARINRWAEQGANDHVVTAWLQDRGGAPAVVLRGQQGAARGHAAIAQIGEAAHHQPRGFAAGVGVNDLDAVHKKIQKKGLQSCRPQAPAQGGSRR